MRMHDAMLLRETFAPFKATHGTFGLPRPLRMLMRFRIRMHGMMEHARRPPMVKAVSPKEEANKSESEALAAFCVVGIFASIGVLFMFISKRSPVFLGHMGPNRRQGGSPSVAQKAKGAEPENGQGGSDLLETLTKKSDKDGVVSSKGRGPRFWQSAFR